MGEQSRKVVEGILTARLEKLKALRREGRDPYSFVKFDRTHGNREVVERFKELEGKTVRVAGRIMGARHHGKIAFFDLFDFTGRVQLFASEERLGQRYLRLVEELDLGDIVGVEGEVFKTRRGEVSVNISDYKILAKCLRPLPEKWHGLRDVELRYRHRYLDLMVNPEVREVFVKRSRIIRAIRALLDERGFVEVETPVMQPLPGGAAARPFITHHNALDIDLYLRIAPELYLKRLLVGGFEKVYEIGKNFRNEGISSRHNPEFTMLEAYQAYADFEDMMKLCEDIVLSAAEAAGVEGTLTYQGQRIDLSPPWRRARYFDLLKEHTGLDFESLRDEKDALEAARKLGIPDDYAKTPWSLMDKAFEIFVQPHLIQPTFVTHYPVEVSPLAKRDPKEPRLVQRFEPFIGGQELGNAFSELNDPVDQRGRFEQQAKLRERGEEEAHVMDEDFLMALEYGMPPAGGLGIGIDRLCMVLLDKPSIREVILFPQLRPEGG